MCACRCGLVGEGNERSESGADRYPLGKQQYKATNSEAQTIEGIAAGKAVERGVDKGEQVGTVLGFLVRMRPTWIEEFECLVCVRLLHALADGCIEYLFQGLRCR